MARGDKTKLLWQDPEYRKMMIASFSKAREGKKSPLLGRVLSEKHKEKLRQAKLGRKCTAAHRKNMSKARKGKKNPFYGKKHSNETKNKMRLAKLGELSSLWRGGIANRPYPLAFNNQIKDRIRVRDNFICQECGVPELECSRRLHVHHIDYNKENLTENNLVSLCLSCHMKTNFKREYWKKRFMKERNEQAKSYQ